MSLDVMKQALEALEFLALENFVELDKSLNVGPTHGRKAIIALRSAIEQAQEPAAWMTFDSAGEEDDIWYDNPDGKLLEGWTYKPLYTAPRQWQGLTDDEIALICGECAASHADDISYARAIEAKLKAKNL